MESLYKKIESLCNQQKINISTMCKESGASRGSLTDLKMGRKQSLSTKTLSRIAAYFGVSVDYLLRGTPTAAYCAGFDDGAAIEEHSNNAVDALLKEEGYTFSDVEMDYIGEFSKLSEESQREEVARLKAQQKQPAENGELSNEEEAVIIRYRGMSEEQKKLVRQMLGI